jgi:hypothetical protein
MPPRRNTTTKPQAPKFSELQAVYEAANNSYPALQTAEDTLKVGAVVSQGYMAANTALNAVTEEDLIRAAAEIAAIVDMSGVSGTMGAFTYPKCSQFFGTAR